jgi:hypothetical protein
VTISIRDELGIEAENKSGPSIGVLAETQGCGPAILWGQVD